MPSASDALRTVRRRAANGRQPDGGPISDHFILHIHVAAAAFMLAGCGEAEKRSPTDEELSHFTNSLEADARRESKAAISEARRGETDRAEAAQVRRRNSARERGDQAAE